MAVIGKRSRVGLRAELAEVERAIQQEEARWLALRNQRLDIQDAHQVEAEEQAKTAFRIAKALGLYEERSEAQRQRAFQIEYKRQSLNEIRDNIARLEAQRETLREALMVRDRAREL